MKHWRVIKVAILASIFTVVFISTFYSLKLSLAVTDVTAVQSDLVQYSVSAVLATIVTIAGNLIGWQVYSRLKQIIIQLSLADFSIGIISVIIGLIMGALASAPLAGIPDPWSWISSILVALIATIAAIWAFNLKKHTLIDWFQALQFNYQAKVTSVLDKGESAASDGEPRITNPMIMDTSAIIDGRINEVIKSGFLYGTLIIPEFIVQEIQFVADSSNSEKRQRGRAGLRLLQSLRRSRKIPVRTIKTDYPEIKEVDAKLVRLAQEIDGKIITCDYNLNAVAKFSGVSILNVNELANYLKQLHLPGEKVVIKISQAGREDGQGVGYLSDGTMVVIQGGSKHIGREVRVEVGKVLQTDAGKMLFGKFKSLVKSKRV